MALLAARQMTVHECFQILLKSISYKNLVTVIVLRSE